MPQLNRRSNYMKIFRPNRTPYTEAFGTTVHTAIESALGSFKKEFAREPHHSSTVIEVVGVMGGWDASVYEIPEE